VCYRGRKTLRRAIVIIVIPHYKSPRPSVSLCASNNSERSSMTFDIRQLYNNFYDYEHALLHAEVTGWESPSRNFLVGIPLPTHKAKFCRTRRNYYVLRTSTNRTDAITIYFVFLWRSTTFRSKFNDKLDLSLYVYCVTRTVLSMTMLGYY
jgi:hypothetical protein